MIPLIAILPILLVSVLSYMAVTRLKEPTQQILLLDDNYEQTYNTDLDLADALVKHSTPDVWDMSIRKDPTCDDIVPDRLSDPALNAPKDIPDIDIASICERRSRPGFNPAKSEMVTNMWTSGEIDCSKIEFGGAVY